MKTLQMVKSGSVAISLQPWKGMPKANKNPEGYTLVVDGKEITKPDVQLTGGGAFPAYTYIQRPEGVFWFSGQFESGTAIQIVDPVPAPTKTVTEAIAGPAEVPAAPAPKKGKQK